MREIPWGSGYKVKKSQHRPMNLTSVTTIRPPFTDGSTRYRSARGDVH